MSGTSYWSGCPNLYESIHSSKERALDSSFPKRGSDVAEIGICPAS
jgi:hypothetical protein